MKHKNNKKVIRFTIQKNVQIVTSFRVIRDTHFYVINEEHLSHDLPEMSEKVPTPMGFKLKLLIL